MNDNKKFGKFEMNEKVYVKLTLFAPCRLGVIEGICRGKAEDGSLTRCYKVRFENEDGTATTERIPVGKLCLFTLSPKAAPVRSAKTARSASTSWRRRTA